MKSKITKIKRKSAVFYQLGQYAVLAKVNGQIKASEVRVIPEDGTDIGVFSLRDALALAASRREDLVEIDSEAVSPVCQAIDYGVIAFGCNRRGRTESTNSLRRFCF